MGRTRAASPLLFAAVLLAAAAAQDNSQCAKYHEFQAAWAEAASGDPSREALSKYDPRKLSTNDVAGCQNEQAAAQPTMMPLLYGATVGKGRL